MSHFSSATRLTLQPPFTARTRFERMCLAEYAEVFKTVCVDAVYFAFPRREYLEGLADQVPDDFQFGFKVTDRRCQAL